MAREALDGGIPWRRVPGYVAAQLLGGVAGSVLAHLMFALPVYSLSMQ